MYDQEIPLNYMIPFSVDHRNRSEQLEVVELFFGNEAPDLFFFNDHFEFYAFKGKGDNPNWIILSCSKVGDSRLVPVGVFTSHKEVCDVMRTVKGKTPQMHASEEKGEA